MDAPTLLSFSLAALAIQIVPGPGMLFLVTQGAAGGPRAGLTAALGAATGMVVHTIAVAAGLGYVFVRAPAAYEIVRVVGGLYLLWLAVTYLRADGGGLEDDSADAASVSLRAVFGRSLLNNLANPKVILFFIAFLPQFVSSGGPAAELQLAVLGLVFLAIGLAIDVPLGILAGRLGNSLRRSPGARRLLHRAVGAILGGLGLKVLAAR